MKTARGGYDGKGQQTVQSKEDLPLAKSFLNIRHCIAEAFVPFTKEISLLFSAMEMEKHIAYQLVKIFM